MDAMTEDNSDKGVMMNDYGTVLLPFYFRLSTIVEILLMMI